MPPQLEGNETCEDCFLAPTALQVIPKSKIGRLIGLIAPLALDWLQMFLIPRWEELLAVLQDPLLAFPFSFPLPPPHQAAQGRLAFFLVEVFPASQILARDQVFC